MTVTLQDIEQRVLSVLIEKSLTQQDAVALIDRVARLEVEAARLGGIAECEPLRHPISVILTPVLPSE